jgi:lipopolysaccharide export system permease protein
VILRRYLIRETLASFALVFGFILIVYLTSTGVGYLGDAASGKLAHGEIPGIMTLSLLGSLKLILPLCLYLGILVAIGRMRRQQELIAYAVMGLGTEFYFRNMLALGLLFAVAVAIITLLFEPWADRHVHTLEMIAKQEADIFGIAPGQFKELSGGQRVIFAQQVSEDSRNLDDVFLRVRVEEEEGVLSARGARIEDKAELGGRFVVFENGRRYDGRPGQADYTIIEFERYGLLIEPAAREQDPTLDRNVSMMSTSQLLAARDALAITELHWRVAMPLATVLLPLLAVALARNRAFGGPYATMLAGILLYLVYTNTLGIVKALAKKGEVVPEIGLLPVHAALLVVIWLVERRASPIGGARR